MKKRDETGFNGLKFLLLVVFFQICSVADANETLMMVKKADNSPTKHGEMVFVTSEPEESVSISGSRYSIPLPWKGQRLGEIDDPQSMGLVMVPLEMAYEMSRIYVTRETRDAFVAMAEAALLDGIVLQVDSGYRSIRYQRKIYAKLLKKGRSFNDIASGTAPPGYSEHMLGTAFDMVPSDSRFVDTPAREWLMQNAEKFCFTESYPEDLKDGFLWEPWHWRYHGCAMDIDLNQQDTPRE